MSRRTTAVARALRSRIPRRVPAASARPTRSSRQCDCPCRPQRRGNTRIGTSGLGRTLPSALTRGSGSDPLSAFCPSQTRGVVAIAASSPSGRCGWCGLRAPETCRRYAPTGIREGSRSRSRGRSLDLCVEAVAAVTAKPPVRPHHPCGVTAGSGPASTVDARVRPAAVLRQVRQRPALTVRQD